MLEAIPHPRSRMRLGLSNTNLLYRWKGSQVRQSGPVAESPEPRVHELEVELQRVIRERDIQKKRWLFSAATSDGCLCGSGQPRAIRDHEGGSSV